MTYNYYLQQQIKARDIILGRGDNLQLFISPLLKYEEWLYNIIDDNNFEINSLEPPVQGVWKFHIPRGDL